MPAAGAAAFIDSAHESPYASANPMKPTVLIPCERMWSTVRLAGCDSFGIVLNIQCRFSSIGPVMRLLAARLMTGVLPSKIVSIIASAAPVVDVPRMRSTLLTLISFLAL